MKIAVIYWSQTGNTQAMAEHILAGLKGAGADADMFSVSEISPEDAAQYGVLLLGCPAMGAEELESEEFEPFYTRLEGLIAGKTVGLFGSYDWGDGEWMRTWQQRVVAAGGVMIEDGLICNNTPDVDALSACRALGEKAAK